jgi:hypothetical protein
METKYIDISKIKQFENVYPNEVKQLLEIDNKINELLETVSSTSDEETRVILDNLGKQLTDIQNNMLKCKHQEPTKIEYKLIDFFKSPFLSGAATSSSNIYGKYNTLLNILKTNPFNLKKEELLFIHEFITIATIINKSKAFSTHLNFVESLLIDNINQGYLLYDLIPNIGKYYNHHPDLKKLISKSSQGIIEKIIQQKPSAKSTSSTPTATITKKIANIKIPKKYKMKKYT